MTHTKIKLDEVSLMRGDTLIYDKLSINIPTGKITGIIGPSGAGKTTLLHLIGGLVKPNSGKILINNNNICKMKYNQLMKIRKDMGVLFQSGALFTQLSVYDNIAFPLSKNTKLPNSIIDTIVKMKLEAVGLRGAASLMPSELSGGMSRRVALARAIALDPSIMMYDEPFAGQDPISMGVILQLIKTLNNSLNMTSIVVTHDIMEIMEIADYVIMISNKSVLAHGSPKAIRQNTSALVKQFLNGSPDGPIPYHYPSEPFLPSY